MNKVWRAVPNALLRKFLLRLLPIYTRRELPGWGRILSLFERGRTDHLWVKLRPFWAKSKVTGHHMLVKMSSWTNRGFFYTGRYYELHTQLLLMTLLTDGDEVADVGANEGMISLLASFIVGERGKVYSFEPNPGPRRILGINIKANLPATNNIALFPFGLSDATAQIELAVPRSNSGQGSFARAISQVDTDWDHFTCDVRKGDDVLHGRPLKLIKIDVEGFEERVLAGLLSTLSVSKPYVLIEMIEELLTLAGSSMGALRTMMAGLGYEAFLVGLSEGRRPHFKLRRCRLDEPWRDGDYLWVHRDGLYELKSLAKLNIFE